MIRIALTGATRKMLVARLQQAYADHATRLIRRIHALLELAEGRAVYEVAAGLGVGEQTVRDWLHAFVRCGAQAIGHDHQPRRMAAGSHCLGISRSNSGNPARPRLIQRNGHREAFTDRLRRCFTVRGLRNLNSGHFTHAGKNDHLELAAG